MSITKFKFVSPGVYINEIDNSQLPRLSDPIGPVIIGRSERGPSMRPTQINSFSDFIEVFGSPVGGRQGDDVWRQGNMIGPTYAAYAAQAWLRNTNALTFIRLVGQQHEDATTAGTAGWSTGTVGTDGGAYGLFIANSGSGATAQKGALAAIWYLKSGELVLKGTAAGTKLDDVTVSGSNVMVESSANYCGFTAQIMTGSIVTHQTAFNFDRSSATYIRNVFNTNPMLTNSQITENTETYFLGQTYDRHLVEQCGQQASGYDGQAGTADISDGSTGEYYAFVAPLKLGSNTPGIMTMGAKEAKSGWIIGQDLTSDYAAFDAASMQKLFRFVTLSPGEWEQKNLKISLQNIKVSPNDYNKYGTFDVVIRKADDLDNSVKIVERFSACNLNPFSANFIGRMIGDRRLSWSDTERRYREYGEHANMSKFVRIEINGDIENGTADQLLLPFGFYGPPRFIGFSAHSGAVTSAVASDGGTTMVTNPGNGLATGKYQNVFGRDTDTLSGSSPLNAIEAGTILVHITGAADGTEGGSSDGTAHREVGFTGSFEFPQLYLRASASQGGLSDAAAAYWGVDSTREDSDILFEESWNDVVFPLPYGLSSYDASAGTDTEVSFYFSLDNIINNSSPTDYKAAESTYLSGSRVANTSVTAISSSYKAVLAAGANRFTLPLYGGYEGVDIAQSEPFSNVVISSTAADTTNYAYYTVKKAVDMCADPEVVDMDLLCMPGLTHEGLTNHMINVAEARGDCLAIIDLGNAYTPKTESTNAAESRGANVATAVSNMRNRGLNSSYGACYFPWVQISDPATAQRVWVPPSILALGAMSYGQKTQELWFAPAGFTRGGLSEGRGGLPVIAVSERLTSAERDDLYDANINPVAQFPAEGIVIFGQKTLQVTESALDRINVRRLMIYVKREISRMAATLLFDQNVQSTWDQFVGEVNPFLAGIRARLGLMDFKVILDETTTTPDLIDRNIMYAKIFLKPAKAVEFIAIDFVITDSGAAFED
jgi:phage tail sheath protein FI